MRAPCIFPGCTGRNDTRGYCPGHDAQIKRGQPLRPIGWQPPISLRILAKSIEVGDCLLWQGHVMENGYGIISWRDRRWLVHRAIWTETHGEIPARLTIDHLCGNRTCVDVAHMEVVTRGENARRGGGLEAAHASYRARTHCKHGHEYTPENTRYDSKGRRSCKICGRDSWHKWAARTGQRQTRRGHALLTREYADA